MIKFPRASNVTRFGVFSSRPSNVVKLLYEIDSVVNVGRNGSAASDSIWLADKSNVFMHERNASSGKSHELNSFEDRFNSVKEDNFFGNP